MKAYLAVNYQKKCLLEKELNTISSLLERLGMETIVFASRFSFEPEKEQEMMNGVMNVINECSLLLAETSFKGIGIGIEAGYAKAKGIPVVYLRKGDAEHSSTLSGLCDYKVIYSTPAELEQKLETVLKEIHLRQVTA